MPDNNPLATPNGPGNLAYGDPVLDANRRKANLAAQGVGSQQSEGQQARWWEQGQYDLGDRVLSSEERMREEQERLRRQQEQAQQRAGVQIDYGQASQDYARQQGVGDQQSGLGDYYERMLNGQGPSVAEQQMQAGIAQSVAAQNALANSARGGTMQAGAAQRMAATQGAAISQAAVNQAAQLRAQEQQAAAAGYQSLLASQRAAELQAMGMSAEQAQAQAELEAQQRAQNDAMTQAYLQAQMGTQGDLYSGQVQQVGFAQGANQAAMAAQQAAEDRKQRNTGALIGAGATLGAGLLDSDERVKEDIADGDADVEAFLDALEAKRFRYRQDVAGLDQDHEPIIGVMAQAAQRSAVGKSIVKRHPAGHLALDIPRSLSATLASLAHEHRKRQALEERIEKLERPRRGRR